MRRALCLLALCTLAAPAAAQDVRGEPPAVFSSDRPGFSSATLVAPRARLITELGVGVVVEDPTAASLPNLYLRTGVFEWLEVRVRAPSAVGVFDQPDARFGADDPAVGIKVGGALAEGLTASTVWEVSLPIGSDGFGSEEASFYADAQLEWTFWGPLTLIPNAVVSVLTALDPATGELVRYVSGAGSLNLWWEIIDVFGAYVQGFVLADERSDDARVGVGAGVAWMVAPNVQVDASFDVGVTTPRIPLTIGAGTTVLW